MTGTCRKAMMLYLAALLSLGGLAMGCGDDDDDGDTDAGFDAGGGDDGGFDAGTDAGCTPDCTDRECGDDGCGGTCGDMDGMCPGGLECNDDGTCPTTVFARVAHMIPNGDAVRLCVYVATSVVGPIPAATADPDDVDSIPFRGVSSYVTTFTADPIDYLVKAYSVDDVTDTCPAMDATDPTPVVEGTISGGDLTAGEFYTIAAIGFADESGSPPSRCGATFSDECSGDQLAHLEVFSDDITIEDDTMTKIRFLHGVPNLLPIDVCKDDDPTDDTPGTELLADVAYNTASDYLETDAITGGYLTLHINISGVTDSLTCPDIDAGGVATRIAVIPIPYDASTGVGTDAVPGSVADFPADQVATMFASGDATMTGDTDPGKVAVIPFLDAPPSAP